MANQGTSNKQARTVATAKKSRAITGQGKGKSGLIGWPAVAAVLLVVGVIVVVSLTGSSDSSSNYKFEKAPASVVGPVTSVPLSSFNSATSAPNVPGAPLLPTKGQEVLKVKNPVGHTLPYVYYDGSEHCPYCAAQRWAIVAALSRFGTFSNLGITTSSAIDSYPSTNTLTFWKAKYVSDYITFGSTENLTNIVQGNSYVPLQKRSAFNTKLVNKYDNPPFVPDQLKGGWPYMDFANQVISPGPTYSPSYLQGMTWQEIADSLKHPESPVAQQILTAANYLSASVCAIDGQQPASVCTSTGVRAAAAKIPLK